MSDQVRINGFAHSWSSIIWKAFGESWTGLLAIDWDEALEVALGYGAGRHHAPTRRSRGKYVPGTVKIKVYDLTAQQIIDRAAALSPNGLSFGVPEWPMVLQRIETNEQPLTTTFDRARIIKHSGAYAEGPELLVQDLEISVMAIYSNKKTLFDSSRGVP
jgi:hypothetical protein